MRLNNDIIWIGIDPAFRKSGFAIAIEDEEKKQLNGSLFNQDLKQ